MSFSFSLSTLHQFPESPWNEVLGVFHLLFKINLWTICCSVYSPDLNISKSYNLFVQKVLSLLSSTNEVYLSLRKSPMKT